MVQEQQKIAVVTGGSRGIGKAVVKRLLKAGHLVVFGSRTEADSKQTVTELSSIGEVHGLVLDVSERESVQQFVTEVIQRFARIDILVNCAGINIRIPAEDYQEEDWEKVLNINLSGAYRMSQEVGKQMIKQQSGKILNITSMQSHIVTPNQSAYASAKGGLVQYTKLLAVEWGKHNIQVNAVSPGFIETEMTRKTLEEPDYRKKLLNQTAQQRFGTPEEVAEAVEFLVSERASFINGHILAVDGGFLAGHPSFVPPQS